MYDRKRLKSWESADRFFRRVQLVVSYLFTQQSGTVFVANIGQSVDSRWDFVSNFQEWFVASNDVAELTAVPCLRFLVMPVCFQAYLPSGS